MPLENDLQNEVMSWLRSRGVFCWRNNSTGVFDPTRKSFRRPGKWHKNGVSDIICVINSRPIFIELKKPPTGNRKEETLWNMCSDSQKLFITDARTHGAIAFVADSLQTVKNTICPLLTQDVFNTVH